MSIPTVIKTHNHSFLRMIYLSVKGHFPWHGHIHFWIIYLEPNEKSQIKQAMALGKSYPLFLFCWIYIFTQKNLVEIVIDFSKYTVIFFYFIGYILWELIEGRLTCHKRFKHIGRMWEIPLNLAISGALTAPFCGGWAWRPRMIGCHDLPCAQLNTHCQRHNFCLRHYWGIFYFS